MSGFWRQLPLRESGAFWPACGAVVCGLLLECTPLGEAWVNGSYDNLFRFGARGVTNQVAVIVLDDASCAALKQSREQWDRALHAQLLRGLAEAGSRLAAFDILFAEPRQPESDQALAEAIRRHGRVVLMAGYNSNSTPALGLQSRLLPERRFLEAATNFGIGRVCNQPDEVVRQVWHISSDDRYDSLAWSAARLMGAAPSEKPERKWIRYYGEQGPWPHVSYYQALSNAAPFRDKVVFIGNQPSPRQWAPAGADSFATPYTGWTGRTTGGVEILATSYVNLVNGEWLRRLPLGIEGLLLAGTGVLIGLGLSRCRFLVGALVAVGMALGVCCAGVLLSYYANYWFPWLVILGGQIPAALAAVALRPRPKLAPSPEAPASEAQPTDDVSRFLRAVLPSLEAELRGDPEPESPVERPPEVPDYQVLPSPFGEGSFGKVWLARNAIGQWQAIKTVYRDRFTSEDPYEVEFEGIRRYKPVSEQHAGLLRIELVSNQRPEGYFYYVMELADAVDAEWLERPARYRPRTLDLRLREGGRGRLPVEQCVRIALDLCETLAFLHDHGLTHRDIKPSNVIFVKGRPKLADVGLVTVAREPDAEATRAGTPGYMPPPPEPQGTRQADIYALGRLLYVVSTGENPERFPRLPAELTPEGGNSLVTGFQAILARACEPQPAKRYQRVGEMLDELRALPLPAEPPAPAR